MNSTTDKTSWLSVIVLIGAGASVALQIGKVPVALPTLQTELGLTLVESGWVVAIFSLIAAVFAAMLGAIADRYGQLFVAVFGMVLTAVAGIAGGFSPNGFVLLLTRTFEGLGFILTVISIPPLITLAASVKHRRAALALWGTYMPTGTGIMLVASGPLLYYFDWRILWWVTAFLILLFSIPVYFVGRNVSLELPGKTSRPSFREFVIIARQPGPQLLSVIFMFYAAQYLIFAGFLPLILISIDGYTSTMSAFIIAFVVLLNIIGNSVSSWLHNRGVAPVTLMLVGCFAMAIGGGLLFVEYISGITRVIAAGVFSGFGGLIPSSLFAEMPRHAPRPSLMTSISGMLVQGSAIGQVIGPPTAAAFIAWYGSWHAAIPVMLIASLVTGVCVLLLSYTDKLKSE